jgi:hypothetical protein
MGRDHARCCQHHQGDHHRAPPTSCSRELERARAGLGDGAIGSPGVHPSPGDVGSPDSAKLVDAFAELRPGWYDG